MAKTLVIDIETRPSLAHVWDIWNQNISLNQLVETGQVICFAAKWVGDRKVHYYSDFHNSHLEMVEAAHQLWDEADILVHYYGNRFDLPHLRREFLLAGLNPPSPAKSVDLKQVVARQFKFVSNKLAHVTEQLGLSGKLGHEGFSLWTKCMDEDPKAWATMRKYNIRDVVTTEELYLALLPWIPGHPDVNLIDDRKGEACTKCGSANLQWRGWSHTLASSYRRFQCQACGSWGRSAARESTTKTRSA